MVIFLAVPHSFFNSSGPVNWEKQSQESSQSSMIISGPEQEKDLFNLFWAYWDSMSWENRKWNESFRWLNFVKHFRFFEKHFLCILETTQSWFIQLKALLPVFHGSIESFNSHWTIYSLYNCLPIHHLLPSPLHSNSILFI